MDTINHLYNGKSWKASSTVSDKDSFFHAAFGVRANENEPYLDKRAKFRRSRWITFLNYFDVDARPSRLSDILKDCWSAIEKYKHLSVNDKDHFDSYVLDIIKAEHDVTTEEISILATLENVRVVLFKNKESEPSVIINPNSQILGGYPNAETPKGEVVLHMERNVFARMHSLVEDPIPKRTGNANKIANVKAAKDSTKQQSDSSLIKYKKGGSAGSEGVQFQVGLLSVFFLNAMQNLTGWQLSTENKEAGKFDDVVIEWPEGATLLQAKHKQSKTKKISFDELVSVNSKSDDFSIPKYYLSYEEIKKTFNVKEIILCTNASVDGKVMKFLKRQTLDSRSMLYYENCHFQFYSFSDEILPHLRENIKSYYTKNFQNKGVEESTISDGNIQDFLGHLKLFFNYPPGNNVEKVIEQLLSQMKLSQNLYVDVSASDVYTKMLDWFQQKDGVYITELYAKAIFSDIWREKRWQRLEKYGIFFQCSEINFQNSTKLLHFAVEGGCLLQEMIIFRTLQKNKTKFLFVNSFDGTEKQKQVVEAFGMPQYSHLVLVWPEVTEEYVIEKMSCKLREILEKFEYKKVVLVADRSNKIPQLIGLSCEVKTSVTFKDLSEDSQKGLLEKENIIFQGNDISLNKLLGVTAIEDCANFLNTEELEILVRSKKIKVGTAVLELNEHIRNFYIQREFKRDIMNKDKIVKSTLVPFREESFPEEQICEMNERVVIISDNAGSGKSTVLTNLAVTMKKKYPHLWVIRIDLNNYTRILKDFLGQNKETIDILELLNFKHSTKLTTHLERSVFSMHAKVVLMLDGFDEISPDYTQLVLSLLSFSREQQNFAKIIVTTRPHLAEELENVLQVESFILESLTEQKQIDFLSGCWMRNLDVDSTKRNKCEEYAEALIEKMCHWVQLIEQGTNHFAANPLHVRMLADIFQENNQSEVLEDWEGCKEYVIGDQNVPKLPLNMNVTRLYKMFIQKRRIIFLDKENPSGKTGASQALKEQFEECLTYHRILAVELILGKKQCELFSFRRQTARNVEMNVLKMGFVQKVDNEFQFAHRTFAEYFVAESLIEELKLPNENIEFQKFLIEEILLQPQFVVHVFFNSFLQRMVDDLLPKTFYSYQCISYKITFFDKNKFNFLNIIVERGYVAIFQLILKCVDPSFFTKTPDNRIEFFETTTKESISSYSDILSIVQQQSLSTGVTFLEHAAEYRQVEMVKFLIEQGANVNVGKSNPPLHAAVAGGHFEIIKLLIDQGANITAKDSFHRTTVLYKAVVRNDIDTIKYLLDKILQSDASNKTNPIIPYAFAYLGRLDKLKELIKLSLDVNSRVENDETLIFGAVRGGQLETVKYLVKKGADVNSRTNVTNTELHFKLPTNLEYSWTAEILKEWENGINAKDLKFSTALHIAVRSNNLDLVELLVNCGADVNLKDVNGNTALHIATQNLQMDIIKFLVDHGANINSTNENGYTALYLAIKACSIYFRSLRKLYNKTLDVIKFLIEEGDVNIKYSDGSTVLHLAANEGPLDIIILLLKSKVDVDVTDKDGRTALHLAAYGGYTDIVRILIENKADCNIRDKDGNGVLHYAVRFNFREDKYTNYRHIYKCDVLRLVIENSRDVNFKNGYGETALHLATKFGNFKAVILLVESGADVNIRDNSGSTALNLAVSSGHLDILEYFITKSDADMTARNKFGSTILHSVASNFVFSDSQPFPVFSTSRCKEISLNIVKIILTKYSKLVNTKDEIGRTALHSAAFGNLEAAVLLVQHGAHVNNQDFYGGTALHMAAKKGHAEIVKFLLERDADVGIRDNESCTALHLAAAKNALDAVILLVEFGVDVDARNKAGNTALHEAVRKGHLNTVEYLVKSGVDIRIRNNGGYTALHLAAKEMESSATIADEIKKISIKLFDIKGNPEQPATDDNFTEKPFNLDIVRIVLARCNKAVDIKDESGRTALHLAALEGYFEVVEVLVNYGADINSRDVYGYTALHAAAHNEYLETVKFLLERGANIGIRDNEGRTPLHLAATKGTLEVLILLVEFGVDLDARDNKGSTALHNAVSKGHFNTAGYLIQAGIDIRIKDSRGYTPLHLAAKGRDFDTIDESTKSLSPKKINEGGNIDLFSFLWDIGNKDLDLTANSFGFSDIRKTISQLQAIAPTTSMSDQFGKEHDENSFKYCSNIIKSNPEQSGTSDELRNEQFNLDIVEVLLARCNEIIDFADESGRTALHLAVLEGYLEVIEILVNHGTDVNFRDVYGYTALHVAAHNGYLETVKFLLERGANIDIRDNESRTSLHLAAAKDALDVLILLVESGVDLNARDKKGNTALHDAITKGHFNTAGYLVEAGVDIRIRNNCGYTPLHLATIGTDLNTIDDNNKLLSSKKSNEGGNTDNFSLLWDTNNKHLDLGANSFGFSDIKKGISELQAVVQTTGTSDEFGKRYDANSFKYFSDTTKGNPKQFGISDEFRNEQFNLDTVEAVLTKYNTDTIDDNNKPSCSKKINEGGNTDLFSFPWDTNSKHLDLTANSFGFSDLRKGISELQAIVQTTGTSDEFGKRYDANSFKYFSDTSKGNLEQFGISDEFNLDAVEALLTKYNTDTIDDNNKPSCSKKINEGGNTDNFSLPWDINSKHLDLAANSFGFSDIKKGFSELQAVIQTTGTSDEFGKIYDENSFKYFSDIIKGNPEQFGISDVFRNEQFNLDAVEALFTKYNTDTIDDNNKPSCSKKINEGGNTDNFSLPWDTNSKHLDLAANTFGFSDIKKGISELQAVVQTTGTSDEFGKKHDTNSFKYFSDTTKGNPEKFGISDEFRNEQFNLDTVEDLLAKCNATVNTVQPAIGNTAPHHAISKNDFNTIECLTEDGVDIRIRNSKERDLDTVWNSIERLAIEDDIEGDDVDYTFSSESSTDICDELIEERFHLGIIKAFLVKCNEAVDIKDELGRTALHLAVSEGHLDVAKVLIQHKADVNIKDNSGRSALQLAVDGGKLDITKLLVKYDRDQTGLHLAAKRGELDSVVLFVKSGIDVNVADDEGYTALHLAFEGGHLNVVKYLVQMGADITEIKNYEYLVLYLAAKSGDLDIMTFFVERCTNISVTDKHGNTVLHSAVHQNNLEVVKFLVNIGIDLNIKNNDGRTALHVASDRDRLNIADFLVEHGADLNTTDKWGSTALHLAAGCSLDFVTFLVERGADIYLEDVNGDTAAIVAKKKGRIAAFNYLQKELGLKNRLFY